MRRLWAVIAFAMLWLCAGSCFAQTDDAPDEGWRFTITPYFLAASLDGKTGVNGIIADLDVPFSDILDKLDAGFMTFATARKGRWFAGFDAMYFKLSGAKSFELDGPFGIVTIDGAVDVTVKQQFYEPALGYRVFDANQSAVTLDVYAGARYTSIETQATLTASAPFPSFPGGSTSNGGDVTWWDPLVGVRALAPFANHFFADMLVDFGGFGVGCDVTYQWMASVSWQFSKPVSVAVGYRYLDQDYDQDGFVYDMAMAGLITGVTVTF